MQVRTQMILIEGLQLKMDPTSADKDAEESESSYTACDNEKWYSYYEKRPDGFSKN